MSLGIHLGRNARAALIGTLLAGAVIVGVAIGQLLASTDTLVTINPQKSFQTISGWEVTADLAENPANPEWSAYRETLMDKAVFDIGINRIRLEVRSGAETRSDVITRFIRGEMSFDRWKGMRYDAENDNDDPFTINAAGFNFEELDWHVRTTVLPMMERLRQRGERLMVNLCFVSFGDGKQLHTDPEEYAEFVLATYQHLDQTFGFVPDIWEVMLEPDLDKNDWTGVAMGQAMAAAGRRLAEAGYQPAFAAPSVTDMANTLSYAQDILSVPGATDYWRELTYHRYRHASPRTLDLIAVFAEHNNLQTGMLEWWFGNADHKVLMEDLVVGNNSAWQGRALIGLMRPGSKAETGETLQYQDEIRFNRLFFNAIRAGAVRIDALSADMRHVRPVAFRDTEGGIVVVMDVASPSRIGLRTMPQGSYTVTYEFEDGGKRDSETVFLGHPGVLDITMPSAGVVSVVPSSN